MDVDSKYEYLKEKYKFVRMPFGRYAGRNLIDVPDSYIAWLLSENTVTGSLLMDLQEYVLDKSTYMAEKGNEIVYEWVESSHREKDTSYSNYYGGYDADYGSNPLWDAMDGCLPNQ